MKTRIHCRMEDMPTIADFMLASVTRDLADFTAYSHLFTEAYLTDFDVKRKAATELILTDSVNIGLKAVSVKLTNELKNLRTMLVRLEGYLNLAKKDLTGDRLGLKKLRLHLNKKNVEGIILNGRGFAQNLLEYKTILMAKGMKQEQIESLTTLLNTIESLKPSAEQASPKLFKQPRTLQQLMGHYMVCYASRQSHLQRRQRSQTE